MGDRNDIINIKCKKISKRDEVDALLSAFANVRDA